MKLLDLLNVIEDDTPIWIYIDHPFPCKKEGLFFRGGAVRCGERFRVGRLSCGADFPGVV